MANTRHTTILTALLLSTGVLSLATGCGGSQKEAEAPTEEPADDGAVNDEMLGLAESDMPDDGFEEEGGEPATEGDDAGGDEMAE